MLALIHARSVATYASSLPNFELSSHTRTRYESMGAVLIDAVLQAGLNYRTVVFPRVVHFTTNFPNIIRCSEFLTCLHQNGAEKVFRWKHSEKIERLICLAEFFIQKEVESVEKLRSWLWRDEARAELLNLHGIGRKTVDYIAMLVGIPSVPIDRHLRNFIKNAGVKLVKYDEYRIVAEYAADLLKISRSEFDSAVWSYMSSGRTKRSQRET